MRLGGWERAVALGFMALGILGLFVTLALAIAGSGTGRAFQLSLVFSAALLIASVILAPRLLPDVLRSRQARFAVLAVAVSAIAIGILGVVNVLAAQSTVQFDLTRAGRFTLAPASVDAARRLDAPLVVTGYFRPSQKTEKESAAALLLLYQQQSPRVKVSWQDPDLNPAAAQLYGVDVAGSLVLAYAGKPPVVLNLAQQTETDLTGALLRLESSRTPTICWATGDGERDSASADQQTGYSGVKAMLLKHNYAFSTLLLSQQSAIPTTCDVVAVVGPTQPLTSQSVAALKAYIAAGGRVLLSIGPWEDPSLTASVNAALAGTGSMFSGGLAIEDNTDHHAQNDTTTPVVYDWGTSPAARDLGGKAVLFPHSTTVTDANGGQAGTVDVASTTASSHLVGQPRQLSLLEQQPGDPLGPLALMRTYQPAGAGSTTRVAMIGSPDFGENAALSTDTANGDLALNTFDWLSLQENLIAISAKPAQNEVIPITQAQLVFDAIVTLVVVPGLFIVAGLAVFVRRRATPA